MKKLLIVLSLFVVLLVGVSVVGARSGISVAWVTSAPGVASGIGARLLCSLHYVSGFPETQARDDLVRFSPLLEHLRFGYDHEERSVSTSFFGLGRATATWLPGLGCALDHPRVDGRRTVQTLAFPVHGGPWPQGSDPGDPDPVLQDLVADMVRTDNEAGLRTRALLVVRDGAVVAEAYADGADATTPLLGWSMAKSVAGIMIGNLAYRGLASPEDDSLFAEWRDDARGQIRLSDLLTMTDGLAFAEVYEPGADATRMLFTEPSASEYALGRPALHAPGTVFNYSSGSTNLLNRLHMERTGGTPGHAWNDFFEHIAVPLGLEHFVFETDAAGLFTGSSYIYASARDWARFGQLMLGGGVLNGVRVVEAEWVEQSTRPNGSENYRAYGYQWWLNDGGRGPSWPSLPADAYAATGNREQIMMVIPSESLVIVRLGWTDGRYPADARFAEIVAAAAAHRDPPREAAAALVDAPQGGAER